MYYFNNLPSTGTQFPLNNIYFLKPCNDLTTISKIPTKFFIWIVYVISISLCNKSKISPQHDYTYLVQFWTTNKIARLGIFFFKRGLPTSSNMTVIQTPTPTYVNAKSCPVLLFLPIKENYFPIQKIPIVAFEPRKAFLNKNLQFSQQRHLILIP